MPEYVYKAKKGPNEVVEGVIAAQDIAGAIRRVSDGGLYLMSVEERREGAHGLGWLKGPSRRSVGVKDLSNFTRQLSDLLTSGITIAKALDLLCEQAENGTLKSAITDVRNACIDGNAFSEALSRHPAVFSRFYVSLVKSGETSGTMDDILHRLADFNDKELEMRSKLKAAMAYPILMSAVGTMTIAILMTFVIPKIAGMFADLGQTLPAPTLFLIRSSLFAKNYWWAILLVAVVAAVALRSVYRRRGARLFIDAFKIRLPVIGDLVKKVEIARFSRTLATLLKNGVPILEALDIVSRTINNEVIRAEVVNASSQVREGFSLARGFAKRSILPKLVISMIDIGEESGKVDGVLFKIAENYDREVDTAMKMMMSLLEPVLILVLGLVVGFIVVSMLLPIFEINFLVR